METAARQESENRQQKHALFAVSNIILVLAIAFVLAMLFIPDFKSGVIRSVMKIGLFQPSIERKHLPSPLAEGKANSIAFINAKGDSLRLAGLKGKVVFLNVWATWCGPCKAELPSINKLQEKFQNNPQVAVLLIDADGHPAVSQSFLKKQNLALTTWSVLGAYPDFLASDAIPFTVVLDKKGFIAYQHMGIADYSSGKFLRFIEKLANE